MDVALVSCRELPEPDPDAAPLARSLAAAGIDARVLAWDDARADWGEARLAVLRSCWNYPLAPDAFLAWAEATSRRTILCNTIEVVRWNLHKRYLLELERAGVPVVPTELVSRGASTSLHDIIARRGWQEFVIKPAISAASFRTRRYSAATLADGDAHLRALVSLGDALVQQYLRSIEHHGERALVWIDGALTHSVRKSPRFEGDNECVSEAVPFSAAEAELARRAVAAPGLPLAYARVDTAPDERGRPLVMELELMEPSLFLAQNPAALERFVRAIAARLEAR
ncbi:MAG: hypothetical protein KBD01_16385 [Acidobacteria bacterium]|nr:hypothetical protein [Acidobacteriota bacterium]